MSAKEVRPRDRRRGLASVLGQWVQDLSLAEGTALARRGLRVAAHRARRLLLCFGDPLVAYELHGRRLLLPLSHQLPHHRRAHPLYDEALGRLAGLLGVAYPEGSLVDVGANVGDTAAILRAACGLPIVCVEAETAFADLLARNTAGWPKVIVEEAFLGDTENPVRGVIASGRGTARLAVSETGQVASTTLPALLARHPELGAPCLVKIDTDGFDFRILLGARTLLALRRPVLFFEYDPSFRELGDRPARWLFDYLSETGYSRVLAWTNVGEYRGARSIAEAAAAAPFGEATGVPGRFLDLAVFSAADEGVAAAFDRRERVQAAPGGSTS